MEARTYKHKHKAWAKYPWGGRPDVRWFYIVGGRGVARTREHLVGNTNVRHLVPLASCIALCCGLSPRSATAAKPMQESDDDGTRYSTSVIGYSHECKVQGKVILDVGNAAERYDWPRQVPQANSFRTTGSIL